MRAFCFKIFYYLSLNTQRPRPPPDTRSLLYLRFGTLAMVRTRDLLLRKQALYPAELLGRITSFARNLGVRFANST